MAAIAHTRGFLAIVFRHSSNGENLAAIRVSQQALQGSQLSCRRDTHLESANVPVDGLPVIDQMKRPGGKIVRAWAVEGDCSSQAIRSNTFSMEWPPKSGRQQEFPEVDRADWFSLRDARKRILKGQVVFLDV